MAEAWRGKMESASAVSLKPEDVFSSGPAIGFRRTRHPVFFLIQYIYILAYMSCSLDYDHSSSHCEDRLAQLWRFKDNFPLQFWTIERPCASRLECVQGYCTMRKIIRYRALDTQAARGSPDCGRDVTRTIRWGHKC
jgi:hypothetical protein